MASPLDYCRMLASIYQSADISQWPWNLICRGGKQQERRWPGAEGKAGIFSRALWVWKTWGSWLPAASGSTWTKRGINTFFFFSCLIGNNEGIWICSRQPWQRIWSANHHVELTFVFVFFNSAKITLRSVREVIVRHWILLLPIRSKLVMEKQNRTKTSHQV